MVTGQSIGSAVGARLGMGGIQEQYDPEQAYAKDATPERSLPAIKDRVQKLTERAGELAARLETIGDRVFGGRPLGNVTGGETLACGGEVGGINDALDALSAQIARAHEAMTRLEAL